jgi:two-component system, chemotaxis family, sensor histidine kinase and response regulator WspE
MNPLPPEDLSNLSMLELFRAEAENQTAILTSGLLELERGNSSVQLFESLMRAAHSLKGAARIVNLQAAVRVAHALEDCFVAAQHGRLILLQPQVDVLLQGVDLLGHLAKGTEHSIARWETERAAEIDSFLSLLTKVIVPENKSSSKQPGTACSSQTEPSSTGQEPNPPLEAGPALQVASPPSETGKDLGPHSQSPELFAPPAALEPAATNPESVAIVASSVGQNPSLPREEPAERVVRLTAENLNRLLALAGESLVDSRWLGPFAQSLQRIKRHQMELEQQLEGLRHALEAEGLAARTNAYFVDLLRQVADSKQFLADRMQELDLFDRRSAQLSQRLYLEVLRTRMRPFSDGVRRFPRMVRDVARSLGKEIHFDISGENTQVDRDILERLEAPLAHLLRNAVDHGCETTENRRAAGKPLEGSLRLEARHSAGVLLVTIADDGSGVDIEKVRTAIVQKNLISPSVAQKLTESELLEFLFLPGFTLKETVTELSGRGFGLDVVQNMIKSVRGTIRLINQPGRGLRVQLQLPLTLSVLRALLVEVAGEPYAMPLSQITRTLKLPREAIEVLEGRAHFHFGDQQIGVLTAHQILECGEPEALGGEFPIVVLEDRNTRYGLVVDRFLGERELVVQPLDPRLGKMRNISAAALMEDGAPVLILDVEDVVRSIEKLIDEGRLTKARQGHLELLSGKPKRVLAVDDSLTVRELERKMLTRRGYLAEVAVDGMDAWNAVRSGTYDLVITDVDMPRMDGIELAKRIKQDPQLKSVPVLIVSYKDREQDRIRGLEAGADYYLTKGSFHDESLIQAVIDLIGDA